MLEARGIVGHDVALPWEVETCVTVAVHPLVVAGVLAEVGSGVGRRRHCLLGYTGVGRSVVGCCGDGAVPNGFRRRDKRDLSEHGSLFEVTVGDVTCRVGRGDETFLDVGRERSSPEHTVSRWCVVDSTHTHLSSIGGTEIRWFLRDELGEMCWTRGEAGGEPTKGRKVCA